MNYMILEYFSHTNQKFLCIIQITSVWKKLSTVWSATRNYKTLLTTTLKCNKLHYNTVNWCVLAKSRTVKNFIFFYALFYDLVKFIMSWKTAKGQLILKGHFGVLKSTKKNQRNFCKNFKNQKSKDTTLLC